MNHKLLWIIGILATSFTIIALAINFALSPLPISPTYVTTITNIPTDSPLPTTVVKTPSPVSTPTTSFLSPSPTSTPTTIAAPQKDIAVLITNFGQKLKDVSVTAPAKTAAQTIKKTYSDYLTPELLVSWTKDPSQALGKTTSSPWPDHITIEKITALTNDVAQVAANTIYMTSNDVAKHTKGSAEKVVFIVQKTSAGWRIAAATIPAEK